MFFFLVSYVVSAESSHGVPIQILVIHGYVLGWRISDSTCWSCSGDKQEGLEDRMGFKPCDHRLLGNLLIFNNGATGAGNLHELYTLVEYKVIVDGLV